MTCRICLNAVSAKLLFFLVFSGMLCCVSSAAVCIDLPQLSHGELELNGRSPPFQPNESFNYTCNIGYIANQVVPKITCILENNVAYWSQAEETCRPVSCGFPGDIENSRRSGGLFTFPNNVTYICNEGFRLNGSPTIYCMPSGEWKPKQPTCETIVCPLLSNMDHGQVISTERKLNSVATYECRKGYKLKGNLHRTCKDDGTWSGSVPSCELITCLEPGPLKHGRIIPTKPVYQAEDVIIYNCDDGQGWASKCLDTGHWNKRPPLCTGTDVVTKPPETKLPTTPVSLEVTTDHVSTEKRANSCDDPGDIKNGNRNMTGYTMNSTVTYSCDDGYALRGKGTLFCLENGKWNLDKLPICVKPVSVPTIIGIVVGIITLLAAGIGGYFYHRWREQKLNSYGEKSKALATDATDLEEIAGLDKGKKPVPVTVL